MRRRAWIAAAILALAGCGDTPEGPGALDGTVTPGATPVGAIVIQFNGTGIGDVTGVGGTQAFAEDAVADAKRVVLVSAAGGTLSFRVEVEDRSLPAPTATIAEAIDTDNEPITDLTGITVRVQD